MDSFKLSSLASAARRTSSSELQSPSGSTLRGHAPAIPSWEGGHGHDQHAADVAWFTGELCQMLCVPDQLARRIVTGAGSHDAGKALVPRELLERSGPLNSEEREQVELHAARGASLLELRAALEGIDLAVEISIAHLHHERWDGSGYPRGLTREGIPLAARIVAVADVYDALVSARSYKPAWSSACAIEYLRDGRGAHFDPACADAMIALAQRLPANWRGTAKLVQDRTR